MSLPNTRFVAFSPPKLTRMNPELLWNIWQIKKPYPADILTVPHFEKQTQRKIHTLITYHNTPPPLLKAKANQGILVQSSKMWDKWE